MQASLYGTYAESAGYGSGVSAVAVATYIADLLPTVVCHLCMQSDTLRLTQEVYS